MARCTHGPCPKCGSRDNRAFYADGSEWCFGCHDYTPPLNQAVNKAKAFLDSSNKSNLLRSDNFIGLPKDATSLIPKEPLEWIKQYGITNAELDRYHFMWSESERQLIFPALDDQLQVIFYQGRYFPKQKPKYHTVGAAEDTLVFMGQDSGDMVILCEDVISAIKIGRYCSAQPIFGSNISLKRVRRLSSRFKHMGIWLDMDKAKESLKTALKHSVHFEHPIKVFVTERDPKELTDQEILQKLQETS